MSYFPALLNLENRSVLVVGGGKIASDKVERLLRFTNEITIISKDFDVRLIEVARENSLSTLPRAYKKGDIDSFDIVVVAVDSIALQERIFQESRTKRVLVNCVDSVELCDFLFPSVVKKGDFLVSFSTSGVSPALSRELRAYFEKIIPNSIEEFLQKMKMLRDTLPKGKKRMELFRQMAKEFIQDNFKHK
jgi:precorrin-2 dehydrogenase/sirohydrochlorin ferrochelatase